MEHPTGLTSTRGKENALLGHAGPEVGEGIEDLDKLVKVFEDQVRRIPFVATHEHVPTNDAFLTPVAELPVVGHQDRLLLVGVDREVVIQGDR